MARFAAWSSLCLTLALSPAALAQSTPVPPAAPAAPAGQARAAAPETALTPAERRAAITGLSPTDPRIATDLHPTTLTFWIGKSARDGILRDIATSPWNADWNGDTVAAFSAGTRFGRFWQDFTIDGEVGAGYRWGDANSPEAWFALYLRYDGFPWRNRLLTTFAISTGLNYLWNLPIAETGTPQQPEPHTSHVLHYLSPELTFALPEHPQHELVIRYSHRSGIFGTMNGVWEGSNAFMLGYRWRM